MSEASFRRSAMPAATKTRRRWTRFCLVFLALLLLPVSAAYASPATTVRRGPADRPRIALTFDDNLQGSRSLAAVRTLRNLNVKATMFVIGQYVTAGPKLAREIAAGGFEIGDHTTSHPYLPKLSWNSLLTQIGGGTTAFSRLTGVRTSPLFRPPYGSTNSRVAEAAGVDGFRYLVLWDIDTNDWRGRSASAIKNEVLSKAHNGAIVLMHLNAPHTYEALPAIVSGLRSRGYELVTVSGLLKGGRRFIDVNESTPWGRAIVRLAALGVVKGYNSDYFGPDDAISGAGLETVIKRAGGNLDPPLNLAGAPTVSRLTLARALARVVREAKGYTYEPEETSPFTFKDVPEGALPDVLLLAQLGLMTGPGGDRFDPSSTVPRRTAALVLSRYLDLPAAPPT